MNKDFKYRVKTLEEFEIEFGQDWRGIVKCSFSDDMDYLLGTDINYNCYKRVLVRDKIIFGGVFQVPGETGSGYTSWNVSEQMVKKIKICPSYNPKKFVY